MLSDKRKRRFFEKLDAIYPPPKRLSTEDDAQKRDSILPAEGTIPLNGSKCSPTKPGKATTAASPPPRDRVFVVPLGQDMSRKRLEIWKTQLQKMKYPLEDAFHTGVNIIVASTTIPKSKIVDVCGGTLPASAHVVTPDWLIHLIKTHEGPTTGFDWYNQDEIAQKLLADETKEPAQPIANRRKKAAQVVPAMSESPPPDELSEAPVAAFATGSSQMSDDDWDARREAFYTNNPDMRAIHAEENATCRIKPDGFVCMTSSVLKTNLNPHLTGPFEELIEYLHVERDEWREMSYKRVVSILKQMPTRVESATELTPQHGFNANAIGKVREILETGRLRKLEAKKADARLQVLRCFSDIWGVGPATATDLYSAGFRTLEELKAKEDSVLNEKQRIGLKHYDDFLVKIPRAEVQEIEAVVKTHIHRLLPCAIAVACGSYRRGKAQSGDVDVLVSDPTADDCGILPQLLQDLHAIGFLTDDLTTAYEHHIGGCDSYMGVCRLKEGVRYRRIDIKVYPRRLFGFAQLYFTGSDHFNRSMRAYAKAKGYSLTDKGLYKATRAKGVKKLMKGPNLICPDERDVFIALQLPYKVRGCFDYDSVGASRVAPRRTELHGVKYNLTLLPATVLSSARDSASGETDCLGKHTLYDATC
ncbi:Aste57867_21880 [Aphanomyces stellatus]|uniref:DNA polymerase n=1 Tax=Aphanomyces stellatus TaxID=120398 RepID=A0A485LKS1_9STRA|nr:hypothetical protein As57867_021811 [Aphanomyces stellatus]VFT98548.1 Aste57867_21880 [Aphanomyces stellatus]